jgi:hypothetical protein
VIRVTALIDIVRELRDTGAFLPHEPDEPYHSGAIDGTRPD